MIVKKLIAVGSIVFGLVIAAPVLALEQASNASATTIEQLVAVNINTADEATLSTLKGVGPAKAKAIIEYRNTNGQFATIEDLAKIKGIGTKILDANVGRIIVSG